MPNISSREICIILNQRNNILWVDNKIKGTFVATVLSTGINSTKWCVVTLQALQALSGLWDD